MSKQQNRVVATVGAVSAILAAGGSTAFASQVKVKHGDTAYRYAKKYHVSLSSLEKLNNIQRQQNNVDLIYPGQTLNIPDQATDLMKPIIRPVQATNATPKDGEKSYVVKSGDNLWTIARSLGVDWQSLVSANPVTDGVLHVGQTLVVPEAATVTTAAPQSIATVTPVAATSPAVSSATPIQQNNLSSDTTKSSSQVANTNVQRLASSVVQTSKAVSAAAVETNAPAVQTVQAPASQSLKPTSTAPVSAAAKSAAPTQQAAPATSAAPTPTLTNYSSDDSVRSRVVNAAQNYADQGIPYVWGGASTDGMDCSGLVQQAYAQAGVNLPHNTVAQEAYFNAQSVSAAKPGDVLFWGDQGQSYHNAIYTGNGQYIAAPEPGQNVQAYTMDGQNFMPTFSGTLAK